MRLTWLGSVLNLLHSDMLGERQNEDWLSQLRSRENRIRVSESMENRMNPRDSLFQGRARRFVLQSEMMENRETLSVAVVVLNWNGLNHLKSYSAFCGGSHPF